MNGQSRLDKLQELSDKAHSFDQILRTKGIFVEVKPYQRLTPIGENWKLFYPVEKNLLPPGFGPRQDDTPGQGVSLPPRHPPLPSACLTLPDAACFMKGR